MAQIGVIVQSQEVPPATLNANNTANAFMVGLADWGPMGVSGVSTPATSLSQAAALVGPPTGGLVQNARTTTNATLFDSADAFFREGGSNVYISRVVGPSPTYGTLALQDSTGGTAATLTAAYVGSGSSAINVIVTNQTTTYTLTLQDPSANVLAASPSFLASNATKSDLVSWAAGTNLITVTNGNANAPKTLTATALSAGSDNRGSATLTNWQSALNSGFGLGLGPGQVMAPGQTNTSLAGIWTALGSHAASNNRVALLDGTDGNTAAQAIAELSSAAIASSLQSYCGLWAGNLQIPGISANTVRVIPPSPVVAALCARADSQGNPNLAAAGTQFPLQYVSGPNTAYSGPLTGDISTLNNSGINTFYSLFQTFQNYGFISLLGIPSNDAIYWQLNHSRLRMAIIAGAQVIAQSFVFSQLDGTNQDLSAFEGALGGMLLGFYASGALYGATSNAAFTVNAGATVNPPSSLAAGNLIAQVAVRMSPYAQLVTITINAIPINQNLVQAAGTTV